MLMRKKKKKETRKPDLIHWKHSFENDFCIAIWSMLHHAKPQKNSSKMYRPLTTPGILSRLRFNNSGYGILQVFSVMCQSGNPVKYRTNWLALSSELMSKWPKQLAEKDSIQDSRFVTPHSFRLHKVGICVLWVGLTRCKTLVCLSTICGLL